MQSDRERNTDGANGGSPSDAPAQAGKVVDAERHSNIAKAAYERAHARNFEPGGELEDWLSAERQFDGE